MVECKPLYSGESRDGAERRWDAVRTTVGRCNMQPVFDEPHFVACDYTSIAYEPCSESIQFRRYARFFARFGAILADFEPQNSCSTTIENLGRENRQYANTQTAQISRNTQEYSAYPARSAVKIFKQYCELVSKWSTPSAHTEYANTQAIQIRSNIRQYHTPPTGISHPS